MKKILSLIFLMASLPSVLWGEPGNSGTVSGTVYDTETNEPVPFVYLHLEEMNRSANSDRNGRFQFSNLPEGNYTLVAHRIGYASRSVTFFVTDGEEATLRIELRPTVLTGRSVEVIAQQDELSGATLEHASIKMTGSALRKNLGATLSETLSNQPGFDQRTMGAAPARPIIRGLGDERVLILQDGERTGDTSAQSADHAVTIDPMGADEIEIARGPSALVYGSNAIGGVINVVRNQIATSVPSGLSGTATLQGSSVNKGISVAGLLSIPKNNFVINVDVGGRYGGDFHSPDGKIENSDYLTSNNSLGVSYIRPWGYTGFAVNTYISDYGIPPDPVGGHPSGVDVVMRKFQVENRNEFLIKNSFLKLVESGLSYRYYNHKELESSGSIGTEFTNNTVNFSVKTRHQGVGFFNNGIIGIWGEFQDYVVFDRFNLEANSYSFSAYTVQEADFGPLHFEMGIRFDSNIAKPKQDKPNSGIGNIRQRSFIALASSVSLIYDLGSGFYTGTTLMHSYRPPSLDELYSEGPHIAAYAFEIGNPDLEPERGFGKELFFRYKSSKATVEISGYHNHFSNYIYPRDTGRQNIFFPDLNDWQHEAATARIYGIEVQTEIQLTNWLVANASYSYTIGKRQLLDDENQTGETGSTRPLPMMPPETYLAGLSYSPGSFSLGARIRHTARQDRIAEFEEPTGSYTLVDLNAQYRYISSANVLHTFSLNVNNLFNREYRNHLSRLKEVFPEPGVNVSLLYRLYF